MTEDARTADAGPAGQNARAEAVLLDAAIPDLDWSRVPPGAQRTWFDAPSGRLAALTAGDPGNPRVVLVPGVTGSKEDFALMLPLLAAAGYFVVSFDMAGQFESAAAGPQRLEPPRRHYDHDLFVADLIHVLESAAGPSHVLGYSFAGTVSQLAFARRPELFASIAFLSCPPEPGQGFRGVKRIGRLSWLTTRRVGGALMIWGVKRNFTRVPPGRNRFVRSRFALTSRQSVGDIIGLMKRSPDLREHLAAAAVPRLVAVGLHDLWPIELHEDFARRIGARLTVYRTGHSPCETNPHELSLDLLELYASAAT